MALIGRDVGRIKYTERCLDRGAAREDRSIAAIVLRADIGRACAETFAREGCRLILAARRREKLGAAPE